MKGTSQLRIIGGTWRSRRLTFPEVEGLRPSTDRIRETLFNWLQPFIEGSRCLDLFAGSGALGLEALSRGASQVVFVDQHPQVIKGLRSNLDLLGSTTGEVIQADAIHFLRGDTQPFDIVFLDPPFRQGLLQPCLHMLAEGWLAPGARVYIEIEVEEGEPELPEGWKLVRSKKAGQVAYHLAVAG